MQFALTVPTVLDRFIQQAVMQALQRRWDRTFSKHSYGFRPGRSAHQAVKQAQQYEQKSALAQPWERKFLGFSFTRAETPKRRIAPKAVVRFKARVRELTSRTRGVSIERMAEELARYLRGWIGYFGHCETPSVLQRLEEWTRRRLRSALWKQ